MLQRENEENIDLASRMFYVFFFRKKWQNICQKIQNGILTRSTRTIDSTFDVTDVDERSVKKIYNVKVVVRTTQHAPVQAIL